MQLSADGLDARLAMGDGEVIALIDGFLGAGAELEVATGVRD